MCFSTLLVPPGGAFVHANPQFRASLRRNDVTPDQQVTVFLRRMWL